MHRLTIGDIEFANPFFAAPLAGITDVSTRSLFKEMGAALVYSEMISGKGLIYGNHQTEYLLTIREEEKPIAYQLFGGEPEVLAKATEQIEDRENVIVDINMGCPVPKVVKNGEGSALLKDPDRMYQIIKAVAGATEKPVTCKMRIGWDEENIMAVEGAKAVEEAGAKAVAIHGRTRAQFYQGKANWEVIKQVKEQVNIPVIGNGDVFSGEDGLALMEETGCDFVMIGRGMLGNPWIFREAVSLWRGEEKGAKPTREEKLLMIKRHFDDLKEEKGEHVAVREMRKHVGWYMKGEPHATELRRKMNEAKTSVEIENIIFSYTTVKHDAKV